MTLTDPLFAKTSTAPEAKTMNTAHHQSSKPFRPPSSPEQPNSSAQPNTFKPLIQSGILSPKRHFGNMELLGAMARSASSPNIATAPTSRTLEAITIETMRDKLAFQVFIIRSKHYSSRDERRLMTATYQGLDAVRQDVEAFLEMHERGADGNDGDTEMGDNPQCGRNAQGTLDLQNDPGSPELQRAYELLSDGLDEIVRALSEAEHTANFRYKDRLPGEDGVVCEKQRLLRMIYRSFHKCVVAVRGLQQYSSGNNDTTSSEQPASLFENQNEVVRSIDNVVGRDTLDRGSAMLPSADDKARMESRFIDNFFGCQTRDRGATMAFLAMEKRRIDSAIEEEDIGGALENMKLDD